MPTYNRWDQLIRVLDAYAAEAPAAPPFELLVCDDASSDATPEKVQAFAAEAPYPVRYLRQTHKGPAAARNMGVANAHAPIILFSDDDCIPTPGIITRHLGHVQPGVACIGQIVWHPDVTVTPFMRFLCPGVMFNFEGVTDHNNASYETFYTANASIMREDFLAAGGFDENFPAAAFEDTELGYRLAQRGQRFVYEPEAIVHHLHEMVLEKALQRSLVSGKSAAYAVTKHPELALSGDIALMRDQTLAPRFYHLALQYYHVIGLRQGLNERLGDEWVERLDAKLSDLPDYSAFRSRIETQYYDAVAYVRELERAYRDQKQAYAHLEEYTHYLESLRVVPQGIVQRNRLLRAAAKGKRLAFRIAGKGKRFLKRASRKARRTLGVPVAEAAPSSASTHAVTYLECSVPKTLEAGQVAQGLAQVRNDGSDAWMPQRWTDLAVNVAYHWATEDGQTLVWDGRRTALPCLVGPKDVVPLPFAIAAPETPGTYRLTLDLVQEHVMWFSEAGSPGPSFTVRVLPAGAASGEADDDDRAAEAADAVEPADSIPSSAGPELAAVHARPTAAPEDDLA